MTHDRIVIYVNADGTGKLLGQVDGNALVRELDRKAVAYYRRPVVNKTGQTVPVEFIGNDPRCHGCVFPGGRHGGPGCTFESALSR